MRSEPRKPEDARKEVSARENYTLLRVQSTLAPDVQSDVR